MFETKVIIKEFIALADASTLSVPGNVGIFRSHRLSIRRIMSEPRRQPNANRLQKQNKNPTRSPINHERW